MDSERAVETAATSSRNLPSQVRSQSESAQADFVLLLPRFQSPDFNRLSSLLYIL